MHVVMVGLSHHTAPVEIREQLTFPADVLGEALEGLLARDHVNEAVILSTCNRTELYVASSNPGAAVHQLKEFICHFHDLEKLELEQHLHEFESVDAIAHLFRVSSSLDSMVIGEGQILAQVKEAYSAAQDFGSTGTILNKLFHEAIRTGKRVRTDTGIGESAVSISYAALELAKQVFGVLEGRSVLVLGAGEMAELTARHLLSNGVRKIVIMNRTIERAKELADQFGGISATFDDLEEHFGQADIIVSSTAAKEPILGKEAVAKIMAKRRNRPIFIFDIAVPRDIEAAVNDLYNVYLYDIDDLKNVVEANMAERKVEAVKAHSIVEHSVDEFARWVTTLEVVPTITALKKKAMLIVEGELEKTFGRMGELDERQVNLIHALSVGIVNKLLHDPIIRVKASSGKRQGYVYTESLRELFDLDEVALNLNANGVMPIIDDDEIDDTMTVRRNA